jgi:hypothetical protein
MVPILGLFWDPFFLHILKKFSSKPEMAHELLIRVPDVVCCVHQRSLDAKNSSRKISRDHLRKKNSSWEPRFAFLGTSASRWFQMCGRIAIWGTILVSVFHAKLNHPICGKL